MNGSNKREWCRNSRLASLWTYVTTGALIGALVACFITPVEWNVLGTCVTCGVSLTALICFGLSRWQGLRKTAPSSED